VRAGARLLTGGKLPRGEGFFYPPTVLADPVPGTPAYDEEVFGPVAMIFRARDLDDALRLANDTRFGLGSSAWTNDDTERERLIDGLEAGAVFINGMVASDPRLPFGGVKSSGHGRELARHGIREFVNAKTVRIVAGESAKASKTE
jgi:succinate-semialdehyde dehydrogenase/glutarate-semialdehyde dehydrogenase